MKLTVERSFPNTPLNSVKFHKLYKMLETCLTSEAQQCPGGSKLHFCYYGATAIMEQQVSQTLRPGF